MRRLGPLLLTLAFVAAASTSSFLHIERARIKLVEQPVIADGAWRLSTDALRPLAQLRQPVAVIAQVTGGRGGQPLTIAIDGRPICSVGVSTTPRRIDCVANALSAARATSVEILADGRWQLDALEIATHHGHSTGLFDAVVLPGDAEPFTHPPLAVSLTLALVLFVVATAVPPMPLPRAMHVTHRVVSLLAVAIVAITMISALGTRYRVVVSLGTLTRLAVVILLPQLASAIRWTVTPAGDAAGAAVPARALLVALVATLPFALLVRTQLRDDYHGNYSGFLMVSDALLARNPLFTGHDDVTATLLRQPGSGYDGQFAFYVAHDPLMRRYAADPRQYRVAVDAVPHRFGRIGFPWLIRAVGGDDAAGYPRVMVWLVVGAIGALAFVLATVAQWHGLSAAAGALVVLLPGFWRSVQTALPEPIAALLLAVGLLAALRQHWRWAIPLLAASLLVRETGLIAVLCVGAAIAFRHGAGRAAAFVVACVLPVAAWRLYVGLVILPDWGLLGFYDYPRNLGLPLAGLATVWREASQGVYMAGAAGAGRAAIVFPLLLVAAVGLAASAAWRTRHPIAVAATLYAALGLCLNYRMIWIDLGNGQRATYELFVLLAVLVVSGGMGRRWRRASWAFWGLAGAYVLWGSFESHKVLSALGLA